MTTREQFTDDEWQQASALPGLVVMAASLSDGKIMPSIRELQAGTEVLAAGAQKYPDNLLLQQLKEGMSAAKEESSEEIKQDKAGSVAEVVEKLVEEIQESVDVIKAKVTADEFFQVREVLEGAASAVVERIGSGFMGSGEKVSESEKAFVERLRTILA
jgi:DNA-binding transcriptional regulator YhcF (GntR family)